MSKLTINILVVIILLSITGNCIAVPVDGYCYLENQTNHEGSKVLFVADSPTAVTDSVYTDAIGYYQIDLEPGMYDITYSHFAYYDQFIPDRLLLNPATISDVWLEAMPGIPISGGISGVLDDTTYFVIGHTEVAYSLTIEPGATILFNGQYYFSILGYLYAVGTEEDSIVFTSYEGTEPHEGLTFWGSSSPSCILKYCRIDGSISGAIGSNASPTIENCLLTGNSGSNGGGIVTGYSGSPVVKESTILNNTGSNAGGVHVADYGVPIFENCIITENYTENSVGGVRCRESSSPSFKNCIIVNNGPQGGILAIENSQPIIENCTISGNWAYAGEGYGIKCYDNASITVRNSIIQGNTGFGIEIQGAGSGDVTYCDFYDNGSGAAGGPGIPAFFGQLNYTNFNNDPCDLYQNIFLDPLFTAPHNGDLTLTATSPCIDAGDPLSRPDPDSTIADLGAYYFDQSLEVPLITISVSGDNIILVWEELPFATTYNIYRSDTPYFDITGMTPIASVDLHTFTDSGAILQGAYFYVVTGED